MPIAASLIVGVYIYSLWASERQRAAEVPFEAADVMMRDLLSFHKKRGGFPKGLKELEGVVWEQSENRNYSNDRRGLTHRNYYYLYARLNPHCFSLWAIPMGSRRDEAATWFQVVTPESQRRWKGGSLRPEDVNRISADPSVNELSLLGLIEQPTTRPQKGNGAPANVQFLGRKHGVRF